jgi:AcrR family transcriptional regulator
MTAKTKDTPTKGETTRLTIEDAAVELFMEYGYHATSMRQIAERAELALGGIYNHFASKEEIFEAIIIDQHPYKKLVPIILATEGESAEKFFENAIQVVFSELGARPEFINLMFIEMVEFKGKHGAAMLREIAPQVVPVFERIIKARKDLRVTSPALLMRSFFGMIMSYYLTEMVISNSVLSNAMPKNSADVYVDIFLHGILKSEEP